MIRILLVEKNVILTEYLTKIFKQEKQFELIQICKEGSQVMEYLEEQLVDVVLMDFLQTNGLVITQQISKTYPTVKVIGFSTFESNDYPNQMIGLGADKCLSKYKTSIDELIKELKR